MKLSDIHRIMAQGCKTFLCISSLSLAASSCESIYESEGDCSVRYQIGFTQKVNIVGADAFSSRVKSLTVYVYDLDGRLVTNKTESGAALATGSYAMDLDVAPGTYDIVAWGGLSDSRTWELSGKGIPEDRTDLSCSLRLTDEGESRQQLGDLFHGMGRVTFPEDVYGTYRAEQVIDLTKDNNRLRVILQHYNGREMDKDDFSFSVTDDNGRMDWDNTLIGGDTIVYCEHTKEEALVGIPVESRADEGEITSITSVMAEIDLGRLHTSHKPVLTVEVKGKDKPVLSLPLIDLLLNAKGGYKAQDFLDRQDDYNLIFYLDDAYGWYTKGGVWVNSWHVIFQDKGL